MLLSRHADANVLDRVARMMGFGVVRGSTFRGGSTALRELAHSERGTKASQLPLMVLAGLVAVWLLVACFLPAP